MSLLQDLVIASRTCAEHGVIDAYGHVSVRSDTSPDRYWMARAVAPELITEDDLLEFDLDSNRIQERGPAAYNERYIHGEIYKARPDVMAVVHAHSSEVIPFADTGVPLRPMHHMGFFIGAGVPVWDIKKAAGETDILVGNAMLGKALAQALGDKSAVLMRGHGDAVAAPSLKLVVGMAYYLNLNARLQYQALQLGGGKVTYLDTEESKKAVQSYERSWDYWKFRLPK